LRRLSAAGGGVFVNAESTEAPAVIADAVESAAAGPENRRAERVPADLSPLFLTVSALAFAAGRFAGEGP